MEQTQPSQSPSSNLPTQPNPSKRMKLSSLTPEPRTTTPDPVTRNLIPIPNAQKPTAEFPVPIPHLLNPFLSAVNLPTEVDPNPSVDDWLESIDFNSQDSTQISTAAPPPADIYVELPSKSSTDTRGPGGLKMLNDLHIRMSREDDLIVPKWVVDLKNQITTPSYSEEQKADWTNLGSEFMGPSVDCTMGRKTLLFHYVQYFGLFHFLKDDPARMSVCSPIKQTVFEMFWEEIHGTMEKHTWLPTPDFVLGYTAFTFKDISTQYENRQGEKASKVFGLVCVNSELIALPYLNMELKCDDGDMMEAEARCLVGCATALRVNAPFFGDHNAVFGIIADQEVLKLGVMWRTGNDYIMEVFKVLNRRANDPESFIGFRNVLNNINKWATEDRLNMAKEYLRREFPVRIKPKETMGDTSRDPLI